MTTQDTERLETTRRRPVPGETAQREAAQREAEWEAARQEAARQTRRATERIRVGSSALREGRPDRMETTTRDRDQQRAFARGQVPRGNGQSRADRGRADARQAGSWRPESGQAEQRPGRATRTGGRADLRAVAAVQAPARPDPRRRSASARAARSPAAQPRTTPAPAASPWSAGGRPVAAPEGKPGRLREAGRTGYAAGAATLPRMPFVLLVLVLLGGGLICLLVINTTLGATSFRISQLQSTNATLATQQEALQQQIAAEKSPAQIAQRAYQLGMRVQANGNILDLRTHRTYQLATQPGATVPLGAASTTSRGTTGASAGAAPTSTARTRTARTRTARTRTARATRSGAAKKPGSTHGTTQLSGLGR